MQSNILAKIEEKLSNDDNNVIIITCDYVQCYYRNKLFDLAKCSSESSANNERQNYNKSQPYINENNQQTIPLQLDHQQIEANNSKYHFVKGSRIPHSIELNYSDIISQETFPSNVQLPELKTSFYRPTDPNVKTEYMFYVCIVKSVFSYNVSEILTYESVFDNVRMETDEIMSIQNTLNKRIFITYVYNTDNKIATDEDINLNIAKSFINKPSCICCYCKKFTELNLTDFLIPRNQPNYISRLDNITSTRGMFFNCKKLISAKIPIINSCVDDMSCMFSYCKSLKNVDIAGINTVDVTNMSSLFYNCIELEELNLFHVVKDNVNTNIVKRFNASNVLDMNAMFRDCRKIKRIATEESAVSKKGNSLNNGETKVIEIKVTNLTQLFSECTQLTDLNFFHIRSDVIDGDVQYNFTNIRSLNLMFYKCESIKTIMFPKVFNTENVIKFEHMFADCKSLIGNSPAPDYFAEFNLSALDMHKAQNVNGMFKNCKKLTRIYLPTVGDYNDDDTNHFAYYDSMFNGCSSLKHVNLDALNIRNAYSATSMFANCSSLEYIIIPDTFDMTDMKRASEMFSCCSSVKTIDMSKVYSNKLTHIDGMFQSCSKLTNIKLQCLNGKHPLLSQAEETLATGGRSVGKYVFDTMNVISTSMLFFECRSLTVLDVSMLNTSNVRDMKSMFAFCESLTKLTLFKYTKINGRDICSLFKTNRVYNMSEMFSRCKLLKEIDITHFVTNYVESTKRMFNECSSLERLNMIHFNPTSINYASEMFRECIFDHINLYRFNVDNDILSGSKIKYAYAKYFQYAKDIEYVYDPIYGMYKKI